MSADSNDNNVKESLAAVATTNTTKPTEVVKKDALGNMDGESLLIWKSRVTVLEAKLEEQERNYQNEIKSLKESIKDLGKRAIEAEAKVKTANENSINWKIKMENLSAQYLHERARMQDSTQAKIDKLKASHKEQLTKARQKATEKLKATIAKSKETLEKEKAKCKETVEKEKIKRKESVEKERLKQQKKSKKRKAAAVDEDGHDGTSSETASAGAKKKPTRRRSKGVMGPVWRAGFEALQNYKMQYGHCDIPCAFQKVFLPDGTIDQEKRKLYNFMISNRTSHRKMRNGLPHHLSPEKIQLLNSIGFRWNASTFGPAPSWDQRYIQLIEFQQEFGHCNVTQTYKKDNKPETEGLGNWVLHQRRKYREGSINPEKVIKLENIGFQWSLRRVGTS